MNISYKLLSVGVLPMLGQHANVIKRVRFNIEWEEGGISSTGYVEAVLDTSNITDFRPLESLTNDDLIAWAIHAQGGQGFVDTLAEYHIAQIAYQTAQLGVVEFTEHFDFGGQQRSSTSLPPVFPTPASGRINSILFDGGAV